MHVFLASSLKRSLRFNSARFVPPPEAAMIYSGNTDNAMPLASML